MAFRVSLEWLQATGLLSCACFRGFLTRLLLATRSLSRIGRRTSCAQPRRPTYSNGPGGLALDSPLFLFPVATDKHIIFWQQGSAGRDREHPILYSAHKTNRVQAEFCDATKYIEPLKKTRYFLRMVRVGRETRLGPCKGLSPFWLDRARTMFRQVRAIARTVVNCKLLKFRSTHLRPIIIN